MILDYLQILASDGAFKTEKQVVDSNITALKGISNEFSIPVIAISSLNRESYMRNSGLAAFKESGGIEYGADVIFSLKFQMESKNQEDMNRELKKMPREIALEVLKNRNGTSRQSVNFNYYCKYHFFESVLN